MKRNRCNVKRSKGRHRVLGPDHPESQFAMANLALILSDEKRYREAERMLREALQGEIKALGDNHPEIGYAWYNLATVEAAQGVLSARLRRRGDGLIAGSFGATAHGC
jgi:hypothetical protein